MIWFALLGLIAVLIIGIVLAVCAYLVGKDLKKYKSFVTITECQEMNKLHECRSCHHYYRGYQIESDCCRSCGKGELEETTSYPWMDVHDEFPVLSLSEIRHCQKTIEQHRLSHKHLELYQSWSHSRTERLGTPPSLSQDEVLRLLNMDQGDEVLSFEKVRRQLGYPIFK